MKDNARSAAVRLLLRTFGDGGYSNLMLDKTLAASELSVEEKRLCTTLYYGVTERYLTLLHALRTLSGRPPEKLDPEVRFILLLGLYQMKYCAGIPARAAVNETVNLCGMFRKKSAAGFVNAVLRRFQREGMEIPVPEDPLLAQEVRWSVPAALIEKITQEQGADFAETFFENSLLPPPTVIRLNPLKATAEDIAALHPVQSSLLPEAFVTDVTNIAGTAEFRKGFFHVQDTASQLCCAILDPQPGETVLDVCAAPGGKSFTLAERMQDQGTLFACDLHAHRVKLIEEGAVRLGIHCIRAAVQDASVRSDALPQADRVLCDVPCSGLGVLRRKPEIRYKPLDSFARLPEVQYRILENASGYLKSGGTLVYSTCTVSKDENEAVVQRFLQAHPEFHPVPLKEFGFPDGWATFSSAFGNCDGFFAARMRKE
ncbi:MAG: 16S rRNA (cytosine(967)-C(5))-methyltransferase RsmB [Oscillospiraceae bacterium]|nr:16S rRNA (cytosine(967)-C(5))-methyltransferase RsmB [Oscillospiraceae bacterium]